MRNIGRYRRKKLSRMSDNFFRNWLEDKTMFSRLAQMLWGRLIENNRKSALNNKRKVTSSHRNGQKSQLALCAGSYACARIWLMYVLPRAAFVSEVGGWETQFTPTAMAISVLHSQSTTEALWAQALRSVMIYMDITSSKTALAGIIA